VLLMALFLGWIYRIPVFIESDTPLRVDLPVWKRFIKRLLYPLLFKIPKTFLPGGTRQAQYFRHYGVSENRIVIAEMTVDVTHIMAKSQQIIENNLRKKIRAEFGFTNEQTVFVYVGRFDPLKGGVTELLEAFASLHKSHPSAALLIVGDGSQRQLVQAAAQTLLSVKYTGRLSLNDVIKAYNAADVALLPSYAESWGLVVNEAMAVGLPVIVTDRVGCVDDLVIDGKTGRIIQASSSEQLREAMCYLFDNPNERQKMGASGRELISHWTLENEANNIVKAWENN